MGKVCCSDDSDDDGGFNVLGLLVAAIIALVLLLLCTTPRRRKVVRVYPCRWGLESRLRDSVVTIVSQSSWLVWFCSSFRLHRHIYIFMCICVEQHWFSFFIYLFLNKSCCFTMLENCKLLLLTETLVVGAKFDICRLKYLSPST